MIVQTLYNSTTLIFDLDNAIDISMPLIANANVPKCFWAPNVTIEPVKTGDFIGDINQGGIVNFKNITINPHGNGTHTECVGHITAGNYTIHESLKKFHSIARLVSVMPEDIGEDKVVTLSTFHHDFFDHCREETIIIRTYPNSKEKLAKDYSGTNPPYIDAAVIKQLNQVGMKHLLTDLPSVDREIDGAVFSAHKAFWFPDGNIDASKTITELVYIPNHIEDGLYLCNIQIISLQSDASPSKILLFKPMISAV